MTGAGYYRTRKPFAPERGAVYENAGGGRYTCVSGSPYAHAAVMRSAGGWQFLAIGLGVYPDGKIDWDYSIGGCFVDRNEQNQA